MLKFTSVGSQKSVHLEIDVSSILRALVHVHVCAGIVGLLAIALHLLG